MFQRLRPEDADLASAPLLLQCLGAFRLRDSIGNDLTPKSRKARAVLAVLAFSGRACSRARLADLLWSDRGEEQAKSSVRQALFELRHLDTAGALVGSGREEIALDGERITTDLALIVSAAESDACDELVDLLTAADCDLLTDLDGIDPEFDTWLRVERAHEPSRTLGAALGLARRLLDAGNPLKAQEIVAQVQRLDPAREEAARLAMQIAHQIGDKSALHRHFELVSKQLRDDCGAEPSRETLELLEQLSRTAPESRAGDSHELAATMSGQPETQAGTVNPRARRPLTWLALALIVLLSAAGALWLALRPAPAPSQLPLVAVLPFQSQAGADAYLADGLWEDTRLALSQGGTLRVLGRATTLEMAQAARAPKAYRDRLDVDFVLEGNVRRQGEQVRVTVGLTRTKDGVSVWNSAFAGRLGDPMALQAAIAQGIEGRLRGRLARGGGTRAEQIATTPEVYALYSEARSLLRTRKPGSATAAKSLLERAVQIDPNYAPAWAMLASAHFFREYGSDGSADWQAKGQALVRRALEIAPNLAEAHAVSGLIGGLGPGAAERSLERAVALDPGNSEAWNWLGNARLAKGDFDGGMMAHRRAIEIDPFLPPALDNLANDLLDRQDQAGFERLIQRLSRAGAVATLVPALRSHEQMRKGDYSRAMATLLALHSRPGGSDGYVSWKMTDGLLRLGYAEDVGRLWGEPDSFARQLRGERLRPALTTNRISNPREFWFRSERTATTSRALLALGQAEILVDSYRRGFGSRVDYITSMTERGEPFTMVPNLAVALRAVGQNSEADYMLRTIAGPLENRVARLPGDDEAAWQLARVRAAQGRSNDALNILSRIIDHGWLPDGWLYPLDISEDPPLGRLRGNPRFEALRKRILDHIARERAELGPIDI